jgi:hypothetical protein
MDSRAGRRPGLDRALVTLHRSCTPRALNELQRNCPLEQRHSGCNGTTEASRDSDTPPWAATTGSNLNYPTGRATPDRRLTGRAMGRGSRTHGRPSGNNYLEAAHQRVCTRARHLATQIKPTEQILIFKNRTFYRSWATADNAHEFSPASCNVPRLDRRKHLWSSCNSQAVPSTSKPFASPRSLHPFLALHHLLPHQHIPPFQ